MICASDEFTFSRIDDCLDEILVTLQNLGIETTPLIECYNRGSICSDCFSGTSTVIVLGQDYPVAMKELQVGDQVLTGNNQYESIYAFAHKDEKGSSSYLAIKTDKSKDYGPIEISDNHLIYVNGQDYPIPAKDIQIGTELLIQNEILAKVIDITKVQRNGLYAPLTSDGTIMVNGIKSSNYYALHEIAPIYVNMLQRLGLSHHMINHLWFSPLRMICKTVSSKTCESYTAGLHTWSIYGMNMKNILDSFHWSLQPFAVAALMTFLFMSFAIEFIMMKSPTIVLTMCAVVVLGWTTTKFGGRNQKKLKTA